jgi:hypothetical protein
LIFAAGTDCDFVVDALEPGAVFPLGDELLTFAL